MLPCLLKLFYVIASLKQWSCFQFTLWACKRCFLTFLCFSMKLPEEVEILLEHYQKVKIVHLRCLIIAYPILQRYDLLFLYFIFVSDMFLHIEQGFLQYLKVKYYLGSCFITFYSLLVFLMC